MLTLLYINLTKYRRLITCGIASIFFINILDDSIQIRYYCSTTKGYTSVTMSQNHLKNNELDAGLGIIKNAFPSASFPQGVTQVLPKISSLLPWGHLVLHRIK